MPPPITNTRVTTTTTTVRTTTVDPAPVATTTTTPAPANTTPAADVNGAQWRDFSSGTGRVEASISGLTSPNINASGLLDFEWEKPGDTIPFELRVDVKGDASKVKAQLYTNANNNASPGTYDAHDMKLVRQEGNTAVFRIDLPIQRIGNYRAVGRISVDGGQSFQWMGDKGIPDIRFRPRDERHDALNLEEVSIAHVNFNSSTGKPGTFADMMESGSPTTNGKYTLEHLKAQGKTAIWMMPPFEVSKWDQRHPMDDAGSPYAVKDFFSVRTELSRAAQGKTGEAARKAAIKEFQQFMKKAHELGIKVILDIPLNHVGHNYEFRDLFVRYNRAGQEIREVKKNDFSRIAPSPEHLAVIKNRLADPNLPDFAEYVAPWMYGSQTGDPRGARSANEKAPGGWFEWQDTAQLNHGRFRQGYSWWDVNPTPEEKSVQQYLTRVLQFWAVDMGVDGFRLDHLTGLPLSMLEEGANLVQADVDKHTPGKTLFFMGEDFHTGNDTRHWLDNGQGGYFHNFLRARDQGDFQAIVDSPYFHDILNLSSHDEERLMAHFGGEQSPDYKGATRLGAMMQLLGGPVAEVAGDVFGEKFKIPFKQYKGIVALRNIEPQGAEMAKAMGRIGDLRRQLPAFQDNNRAFLQPRMGGADPDIVAMSRFPDEKDGTVAFVMANMSNGQTRENAFHLDGETRSRINPAKTYQVFDVNSDTPDKPLWNPPMTGQELLDRGIFARLSPYQVQVLKLVAQ